MNLKEQKYVLCIAKNTHLITLLECLAMYALQVVSATRTYFSLLRSVEEFLVFHKIHSSFTARRFSAEQLPCSWPYLGWRHMVDIQEIFF